LFPLNDIGLYFPLGGGGRVFSCFSYCSYSSSCLTGPVVLYPSISSCSVSHLVVLHRVCVVLDTIARFSSSSFCSSSCFSFWCSTSHSLYFFCVIRTQTYPVAVCAHHPIGRALNVSSAIALEFLSADSLLSQILPLFRSHVVL
jgi:hypothetical protein